ncbi:MAG TPA: thioredoxin domain-containing protein, partial [Chitinophagaceae bacterium]|nr:thioredoxin domain-containing protein [Chitinophagaceae bacterium]
MPHANRLVHETSPYLLQHAHNPVDWFPWGEEALEKAKREDKPILVSIGYAACHWCHVMERESFENEETAAIMNEHFVNIKIDREERPDLDHIYMDAVQAMTGSGGWPLNVFLTPDCRPFYGGTYFPPKPAFNRASWTEILQQVSDAFKNKRTEIDAQADNLTDYLERSNSFESKFKMDINAGPGEADLHTIYNNCMKNADRKEGGFGNAPKFPQTFTIQYLLRYYHFTKKTAALEQACLSLDKMVQGGIYDQVGGGFARYSTDAEWLAPHFEKMLYDNALLVSVLSEAYQLTNRELYRRAIEQTMDFIHREMLSPENGFYSALDADSEGEEGKFYVWDKTEIDEVLGDDAELFCAFYDVSEQGNWEGHNILRVKKPAEEFAAERGMSPEELEQRLQKSRSLLLERRSQRIRPALDDKILLSWNSLMNMAYSKAYTVLQKEEYRQQAVSNMQFMLKAFATQSPSAVAEQALAGRDCAETTTGGFHHTYKN